MAWILSDEKQEDTPIVGDPIILKHFCLQLQLDNHLYLEDSRKEHFSKLWSSLCSCTHFQFVAFRCWRVKRRHSFIKLLQRRAACQGLIPDILHCASWHPFIPGLLYSIPWPGIMRCMAGVPGLDVLQHGIICLGKREMKALCAKI